MNSELVRRARSWIDGDPDPDTREELKQLIETGDIDELEDRMAGTLQFGTAGLRGEVAAGPNRMNRAVVIRTTKGLADYLVRRHGGPPSSPVIVGFDARPSSRRFAEDTAGVLAAAGIDVRYFPEMTPTPLVAFAAKHYGAAAAVVITASHNPPADNGYKVYAGNAAQIIPPMDVDIAVAIEAAGPADEIRRFEPAFDGEREEVTPIAGEVFDLYREEVEASRPQPQSSSLEIVYTPLHGVGGEMIETLFSHAGHSGLVFVPEQAEPDGTFPTVAFPNPEEEGALDLAIGLAISEEADLVIANDPDADRLAAVVPVEGEWKPLTGNEVGVLLGDYMLRHHQGDEKPIVISTIVSSPMLGRIAEVREAHFERTLTGFKWISNAGLALEAAGVGRFVFGYEEALGYTVGRTVRDKDGMSAALVFCDLVAGLAASGKSVHDRLAELWEMSGLWASTQHSIVRAGPSGAEEIEEAVRAIADDPPAIIGDKDVTGVADYRTGSDSRPPWLGNQDLVELALGDDGRVLVRPSGTEPKLKIYVDLASQAKGDVRRQHAELEKQAEVLATRVEELLPL